jgi:serine/threonine protein kinase
MLPLQRHPPVRTTTPDRTSGRKRGRDGSTPIQSLLEELKALRCVACDLSAINSKLSGHVQEALQQDEDGSLLELFQRYGYSPSAQAFSAKLDLYCLSSALSKHRFIKVKTLGAGSYAVVYKARNRETGEFIALKKLRFGVDSQGIPSSTLREITLLRDLKHPNIVE